MLTKEKSGEARWDLRRSFSGAALAVLLLTLLLGGIGFGQDLNRKVIARTAPTYPELAKRMHLSGKVKLEVIISPAGSVKSAKLVGGNPVFEQSALDAVTHWKFEASEKETKTTVLMEFAEQ